MWVVLVLIFKACIKYVHMFPFLRIAVYHAHNLSVVPYSFDKFELKKLKLKIELISGHIVLFQH